MMCKKTIQEKKICPHIKTNGNVHIFVSKINKDKQKIISCLDCDTDLGVIYSIPLDYSVMIYKEGLKLAPLIVTRLKEMGFKFNNVVNSISFNELYKEKEIECNQAIKKSENIDQHVIINNQINKITDLETEVKRLEKIVIGLSERLINKKEVL